MKGEFAKKWLGKLTKLNAASGSGKCRGKAPHKPLLLLCLLDMAEAGELLVVSRYFEPRERVTLLVSLGLCVDAADRTEPRIAALNKEAEEAARKKGRSARFAVQPGCTDTWLRMS